MDAVTGTRVRRQIPLLAAVAVFAAFLAAHLVLFQPLAARYAAALAGAQSLGLNVDPSRPPTQPPLVPRVFTLLMNNSLPVAEANVRSQSGALTAEMVQSLSSLAAQHHLEVIEAEPGLLTTQATSVELRAHLRLRGDYPGFVSLLDDLAGGGRLWLVERFTITPGDGRREDIEIWVSSCVLKRAREST